MKPVSVGRFPRGFFLLFLLLLVTSHSVAQFAVSSLAPSSSRTAGCCSIEGAAPTYLGVYLSDGKFRPSSSSTDKGKVQFPWSDGSGLGIRPAEVPNFINLHPLERVVENYQPPARAQKTVRRRFFLAGLRDNLVTLVYGRERALIAPQHLTSDSRGRIIVSDPGIGAVHILDGANSFRIAAGENRRLRMPMGVAVDSDDNIYVTDPDLGAIVVFDRNGSFLRELGKIGNETLFHQPTGIAIDRQHGRLYLLDTAREVLFLLDLEGNILKRVGRGRGVGIGRYAGVSAPVDLNHPTEIALSHDKLSVLDASGSRIRILNLQCDVLAEFRIQTPAVRETESQIGLGMDSAGNVYVSSASLSAVRSYDPSGRPISSFAFWRNGVAELHKSSSLWVDSADRIYIADTNRQRIQVFQMPTSVSQMALPAP